MQQPLQQSRPTLQQGQPYCAHIQRPTSSADGAGQAMHKEQVLPLTSKLFIAPRMC